MWTTGLCLSFILGAAPARAVQPAPLVIGHYVFPEVEPADTAVDQSGFGHHGRLMDCRRGQDPLGSMIRLGPKGYVSLPAGRALFGQRGRMGSVEMWVRPSFGSGDLPSGLWEGYRALFYAMQTDGNGLPDGYDEIGLFVHGKMLCAKVCGRDRAGPFAIMPNPLKKGEWAHVVLTWAPDERALFVNGEPLAVDRSMGAAPLLDDFPAEIGRHPSSKQWNFEGDVAGVRLFAQALSAEQVRESYRKRESLKAPPGRGAATINPAVAWLGQVQWGEPWRGNNAVRFRATNCAGADKPVVAAVRTTDPPALQPGEPRRLTVPRGGSVDGEVSYRITGEGAFRLFLVVAGENGTVLGGSAADVDIPALSPRIVELGKQLEATKERIGAPGYPAVSRAALAEGLAAAEKQYAALREAFERTGRGETEQITQQLTATEASVEKLSQRARIYAAAQGGQLPAFGLGVDSGLRKYLKSDPFQGRIEAPVEVSAARGEAESAQVLLLGLDQPLKNVQVTPGPLVGPGGRKIEAVSWNLLGYVATTKPTYEVRYVGLWPDPLLPPRNFDVAAGDFETVWLTIRAPRGVPAGDYVGEVTIAPENAPARRQTVKLHVWDFDLPERSRLTTAFGLNCLGSYEQSMNLDKYLENARDHRISLGFPGTVIQAARVTRPSFDWTGVTKLTMAVGAVGEGEPPPLYLVCGTGDRNTQVFGPIPAPRGAPAEVSVAISGVNLFSALRLECRDPKPVTYTLGGLRLARANGERVFDDLQSAKYWRAAGAWAEVAAGAPGVAFTVRPGPLPEGQQWLSGWPALERTAADSPADVDWTFDFKPFDESIERALPHGLNAIPLPLPAPGRTGDLEFARQFVAEQGTARITQAYADHLREKGWLGMAYTYISDEPEPDQYPVLNLVMQEIRTAAPDLRNMMTARSFPEELKYVDIWCPEVYSFNPELAAREQAQGKRVWWYPAFSTRHPFPDFWVDYPAIDCRVIFWMTWKHHLDGLLYWSISNWYSQNPWENAATFPGANGDGTLIYPGPDGGPVNSIRWENLRDGSEDYDYLSLLRELAAKVKVRPEAAQHADLLRQAEALAQIDDQVVASWKQYSYDPQDLLAARQEMGECLERLARLMK
jgi:hypothetical protein